MHSVTDFKARLIGGGARANLFRVECPFPTKTGGDQQQASFMIKSAALPASTQGKIEIPFRGRKFKIPGDRTFDTWTVKVINDSTFDLRNAFENWIDISNPAPSNTGDINFNSYMCQLQVIQMDKAGNDIKRYLFVDAFPTSIGAIEVAYETNDAIEEFDVTFEYQYWISNSSKFVGNQRAAGSAGIIGALKADLAVNISGRLGGVGAGVSVNV